MPRRARITLLGAGASVGLLILTWYAAVHVRFVERADLSIVRGFTGLSRPWLDRITNFIADLCNPKPFVFLAALVVLVALMRRRPRVAVSVGLVMLAANETTQLLKPLVATPRLLPPVGPDSWPSGHATAVMSLVLCAVIVAPARRRPMVGAVMAAFSVAVCYSFLELGWHYPSDVLGGFLVAATWTLLGAAALDVVDARWPRRVGQASMGRRSATLGEVVAPIFVMLLGALGFAALLALARPHAVVSYAGDHKAFLIGAAGIGAVSLVLATGAILALRVSAPAGGASGPQRPQRNRTVRTGSDPAPTAVRRLRWRRG